jgi:hypothetical protein
MAFLWALVMKLSMAKKSPMPPVNNTLGPTTGLYFGGSTTLLTPETPGVDGYLFGLARSIALTIPVE